MQRNLQIFLFILITSLSLIACQKDKPAKKSTQTYTVVKKPTYTTLYFLGNLQPYKERNITAPIDGTVIKKAFTYGQDIKKGQLLFTIQSSKIRKDFETALTAYLKAKQDLNHQASNYQNTANLYKNQLVSRDEYTQAKNAYYLSQISLLQARANLKNLAKYFEIDNKKIFSLSIDDIKTITKTFKNNTASNNIKIKANASGIALFPQKTESNNSNNEQAGGKKVFVGSIVKQGQLLVTIGEKKGLSMSAKANEININQLKTGLKATVTSIALPGTTLSGEISSIDHQASSSGALPQFNLNIYISKIPASVEQLIRIGMSAKAAIKIQEPAAIQIPIKAVHYNSATNQASVQIMNPKTGSTKTQIIETGKTFLNTVVVSSGLNVGDKVVY